MDERIGQTVTVDGADYRILRLLGKGKGGYSYLAKAPGGEQVTVKQIHHEPCAYYQFGDKLAAELNDYRRLREAGVPVPELLVVDRAGERLVKAYIPGSTVCELVLADALPDWCLRQVESMAGRLRALGLNIHYFPTNFIPHGGILWYVDYECNSYMGQWDFPRWGRLYWSKSPQLLAYAERERDA